jgi:hypothetical protein
MANGTSYALIFMDSYMDQLLQSGAEMEIAGALARGYYFVTRFMAMRRWSLLPLLWRPPDVSGPG